MRTILKITIGSVEDSTKSDGTRPVVREKHCKNVRDLLFNFSPQMWIVLKIVSNFPGVTFEELVRDMGMPLERIKIEVFTLVGYGLLHRPIGDHLYLEEDVAIGVAYKHVRELSGDK